ncbi:Predicted arabinose efflux permease, MFS family [Micromonospora pallida]|uniref:Predicted arabinose efflux permease, MFS family n=1 Tax=Micromonospora pallida TaxID=145854 RepID=A0A1C6T774_9ACTN|nr:MFS transporter [Micromonospora pallida]SCL37666.1 Predicted arabinose efflux permease, MFS family [Micromonospora pallida]
MTDTTPATRVSPAPARPVRVGVGAIATTVACVLPVFLLGGLAVQMGAELGFSPTGLGVAVAVYFGVSAVASIPSGALVERYGPTRVARAGILLAAGSLLAVAAFARSYPVLVALLAVSAAANALGQIASNAALARHVPTRRQGLSFGAKQAAIPVATLLAGAAVPAVALTAGWRWAFVIAAGAAVAALGTVPGREPEPVRRTGRGQRGRPPVPLVLVGVAGTLAAAAANALGTFLVDSAAARGLDPGLAGLTLTLGSAVCVLARVGSGWLADRRTGSHVAVIAGMLGVGALGLALLAVAGTVPLVVGVVLGFGLGWAWPGVMNFAVVRLYPQTPAVATSITQTGVYAGGCLGPLALGLLAGRLGYPTMWATGAAAMLLAAALMLLATRTLPTPPAPASAG